MIHDPKGEWLRTSYNPATDLIFAPFDQRTCAWDLWADFSIHPELKHSLVATAVNNHLNAHSDNFWRDSATELLKTAISENNIFLAKQYLLTKKNKNQNDRTFQSIFSAAMAAFRDIAIIQLTTTQTNIVKKTIDDFLSHSGCVFLLNNPSCSQEQNSSLSLLLSAFMLQAISLSDVKKANDLRAAVIMDEALTFQLPNYIEKAIFSQSRSKGLCIVASAQHIPDSTHNEQGLWARQASNIFAMKVSDLKTREEMTKRIGKIVFNETQVSENIPTDLTANNSFTKSEIQRQHNVINPESFGALKNREFILFHENGIAPGIVLNVDGEQDDTIKTIEYRERKDVIEFMKDF